jgi:hypothetical protein
MAVRDVSDKADTKTGRYYLKSYVALPYYVKPSIANRWSPEALLQWVLGFDVPGMKGNRYWPQGYLIKEVGPEEMINKGQDLMTEWEQKLTIERPSGCPFSIVP